MTEAVPVSAGLESHLHGVVAGVEDVRVGVGFQGIVESDHRPGRVVSAGNEPHLDAVGFQRHGQREGFPSADTVAARPDRLLGDQVEGTQFVVVTPAAPVTHPSRDLDEAFGQRHGRPPGRWSAGANLVPGRSQ